MSVESVENLLNGIVYKRKGHYVSFEQALKDRCERVKHNAHCFLFCRTDKQVVGLDKDKTKAYDLKAIIMMHMRFDGHLGFPGGRVDTSLVGLSELEALDEVTASLNREMTEEISYDSEKYPVTNSNYLVTERAIHNYRGPAGVPKCDINYLHFYGREVPEEYISILELDCITNSKGYEYGREVMGNIRVPLYTFTDDYRGLPAFLKNNFVASSRCQLLVGILKFDILSVDEVNCAIQTAGLTGDDR